VKSLLHLKVTASNAVLTKFQHSERFKLVRGEVVASEKAGHIVLCLLVIAS
jgi:hypothetical protein